MRTETALKCGTCRSLALMFAVFLIFAIPGREAAAQLAPSSASPADAYRQFALSPGWLPLLRSPPSAEVDPDGLVGLNRGQMQYPELQSVGGAFVLRGVLNKRDDWRQQGWRILDAGFIGLSPEGKLAGLDKDLTHSSSFLLYSLGEALIVDPKEATPERVKKFLTAVRYLASEPRLSEGRAMAGRFTHRAFLWSFMFKSAALLEADGSDPFYSLSRDFMEAGLSALTFDGVFPEVGGFDAMYQSIGLDMLVRTTAFELAPDVRDRQTWAATRGLSALVARIQSNGQLLLTDSRRVTKEKSRSGSAKVLSHWQIAQPLYAASILTGDAYFTKVARRVMGCNVACQITGTEVRP